MYNFFDDKNFSSKSMDLFQLAVLNPQIAMLSFLKFGQKAVTQPQKLEEAQQDFLNRLTELQEKFVKNISEKEDKTIDLSPEKHSGDVAYYSIDDNPLFELANQFYDTTSHWMLDTFDKFEDIDPKLTQSARFFLTQYINMMAPKNFPFLNADFWKKTLETKGENIQKGMEMLIHDMMNGAITTNDRSKFRIGENVASTPGKVIFRNDLIELIQYSPTTEKVFARPILFVPPWINKFYILDLTTNLSLVKWMVDQGFTVFMISWINPDKRHRDKDFSSYIVDGVIAAIDQIYETTKSKEINALGYCVGGTLIAIMLAYIKSPLCKHVPKAMIKSATLLTTLLDFEHSGDMAIFMAENYLDAIAAQLEEKGYLDGQIMFNTFSALKSNDMVWRYFIDSYMLGKRPQAHEILFWNSDLTNITEAMEMFLSHDLYRDNLLKKGDLKILGVPIDLKSITTPIYMISMIKDHLVPWKAAFDGLKLFKAPVRFVVGGSGHVAGAINHPSKNKYSYWTNEKNANSAQEWLDSATEIAGSWWNDWVGWLKQFSGDLQPAKQIEKFLADAPGTYVLKSNEN